MLTAPFLFVHTGVECGPFCHGTLDFSPADPILQPGHHTPCPLRWEFRIFHMPEISIPENKRVLGIWRQWHWQCALLLSSLDWWTYVTEWSGRSEKISLFFFLIRCLDHKKKSQETEAWETIIHMKWRISGRALNRATKSTKMMSLQF